MNEFHARRWSQTMQWRAMQRLHPVLWKMTRVTGEKCDLRLFQEEYARVNAKRTAPLQYLPTQKQQQLALPIDSLLDNDATAISARAHHARDGSYLSQHIFDFTVMHESIPTVRAMVSLQNLVMEDASRVEGVQVPSRDDEE